jgi:hypothetical protein
MVHLSVKFLLFNEKIMFKSQFIKTNTESYRQNRVDTNGEPVFAPDCSATVSLAKMCTNHHECSF